LRFVEHDDALAREAALRAAVLPQELPHLLNERVRATSEGVCENLHERTVAR
jgi:hypothetical protein